MERKIGEIFEYNGDWYQCVKCNDCANCNFINYCRSHSKEERDSAIGLCVSFDRSDRTHVIFKKLEKVGEPYMTGNKLIQRYKIYPTTCCINVYGWYYQNLDVKSWTIDIELKQNKEDMEEKKQKLDKLVDDYMACRIQYAEFEEEIKALYDKEESEPTLKEFDLEAARSGKPVCTRDGRKARIICFDVKGDICPIIALVEENGMEVTKSYDMNGSVNYKDIDNYDLMMLPEKKEGWVNVYDADTTFYFVEGRVYDTKEEAIKHINPDHEIYTTTVKIEWEK